MFAEIQVKEPIEKIAEDWDFFEDKVLPHFSAFKTVGQTILGIRQRHISVAGLDDPKKGNVSAVYEIGPKGKVGWYQQGLKCHVVAAGTPHHMEHNFGFWHINDKDELYLPLPGSPGFSVIIQGIPTGEETDRIAWYCDNCLTMLFEHVYESGKYGFDGIWKNERIAVTKFNADESLRPCPECDHVNPRGYCFNPAKDTPEEAEARKLW